MVLFYLRYVQTLFPLRAHRTLLARATRLGAGASAAKRAVAGVCPKPDDDASGVDTQNLQSLTWQKSAYSKELGLHSCISLDTQLMSIQRHSAVYGMYGV